VHKRGGQIRPGCTRRRQTNPPRRRYDQPRSKGTKKPLLTDGRHTSEGRLTICKREIGPPFSQRENTGPWGRRPVPSARGYARNEIRSPPTSPHRTPRGRAAAGGRKPAAARRFAVRTKEETYQIIVARNNVEPGNNYIRNKKNKKKNARRHGRLDRRSPRQPPGRRDLAVPDPARPQPGRLVSLGPRGAGQAKAEDKPIFLSIGYSACHWCHVMERESFERRGDRRADERALRQRQGRPRGAAPTSTRST
jgi:hypothetical protein